MISDTDSCAALILKTNGVITHYTDTIIGFACLPKESLLQRLVRIKNRPNTKGFIMLASTSQQVSKFTECSSTELTKLDLPQNKPTTWLVKSSAMCPPSLLGASKKIAVRITRHAGIQSICDQVGPIVSTSANLSNQAICTDLKQVRNMFGPAIDYVHWTKNTGTGRPSTVIDLASGKIIRE